MNRIAQGFGGHVYCHSICLLVFRLGGTSAFSIQGLTNSLRFAPMHADFSGGNAVAYVSLAEPAMYLGNLVVAVKGSSKVIGHLESNWTGSRYLTGCVHSDVGAWWKRPGLHLVDKRTVPRTSPYLQDHSWMCPPAYISTSSITAGKGHQRLD